jgi:GDP/UDP-N,N'-diacetylbacillosamine 2-epimerase (hydrolysing)
MRISNKKKIIKIGVLTSSRADYGIYSPLLKILKSDKRIELHIIAFGMHLLKDQGYTFDQIKKEKFKNLHKIKGMTNLDSPKDISNNYGNLILNFSKFWNKFSFNWVLALGDRFEMSAAVQSAIPFEVNIAHLHAGETTLGAIDNIYRDQISLASKMFFTANNQFSKKLKNFTSFHKNIYSVGSLSLSNIRELCIPEWISVCKKFNILNKKFVLVTFHPETVNLYNNKSYLKIIEQCLAELSQKIYIIITQSNSDTMGSKYRKLFESLKRRNPENFCLVKSFGRLNYFAAMKKCEFLLGNTSSGIIEAASFNKFVVNVGDRQKGRLRSKNVLDVDYDKSDILSACSRVLNSKFKGKNVYEKDKTSENILSKLIQNS